MGLSIPYVSDPCAYDPYNMAVCTTETMVNDMHMQRDKRITVSVKCTDTTRTENGILCCMHPAEGFWLFKVRVRLSFSTLPWRCDHHVQRAYQNDAMIVCRQHTNVLQNNVGGQSQQHLHEPLWKLFRQRVHADQHALLYEQAS